MAINDSDGGPAFASDHTDGMSLRDYFAAAALTGYLAAHADPSVTLPIQPNKVTEVASDCYAFADAMLVAREQPS